MDPRAGTPLPGEETREEAVDRLDRQVRDALHHLDDTVYLQRHPLVRLASGSQGVSATGAGKRLWQSVVDAIVALRPSPETPSASPAWRSAQILRMRYVDGLTIEAISAVLAIGKTEYHQAQRRGLMALTSLLAERWGLVWRQEGLSKDGAERGDKSVERSRPSARLMPRGILPRPPTSFIGREREIAAVQRLLGAAQLVTLTGPPGSGKTRLALAVAESVADAFPDGTTLVALAPVRDTRLVVPTIASALGIREAPGATALDLLRAALSKCRLLLVLDNCEQVLDAGPALADLLSACPELVVLATSRAPLRLSAERVFAVPPLDIPPHEPAPVGARTLEYAAVRLFLDRATAAGADVDVTPENASIIASICRRLDGLPLGIELAAARARVLPPPSLLARLERRLPLLTSGPIDAPARHQTFRAAIDWSHDLLEPNQKILFRRLTVFVDGGALDAVAAVCGEDGFPDDRLLDALDMLVQQSLVRQEARPDQAARFAMLESIREYAAERLEASEDAEVMHARHAAYYLALAERAQLRMPEPERIDEVDRVARELDNLRVAMGWFVERRDVDRALRLGAALAPLWWWRGYYTEGRAHLATLLALAATTSPSPAWAQALRESALLAYTQGDYVTARWLHERCLAMWRALGDRDGVAAALSGLGVDLREMGDFDAAREMLEQSLAIYRELGDRRCVAFLFLRLGELDQALGDSEAAQARYEASLALFRELGERPVRPAHHLGTVALDRGDYETARHWFAQSLRLQREWGQRMWAHSSLADFASLEAAEGRSERSMRLAGAIAGFQETTGAVLQPTERGRFERWREAAGQALGEDVAIKSWAAGRAMSLDEAIVYALNEDAEATHATYS